MPNSASGKWVTFGVLLAALLAGVGILALAGNDGGGGGAGGRLLLERTVGRGGLTEVLASVPESVNKPEVAKGKDSVGLECTDGRGDVVLRGRHPWPFIYEEGYALPHTHQAASQEELDKIAACRVTGTTEKLEGRLGLSG